ncbi:PREDICTED: uncharacterized protein LOC108359610 [Rhagoletis zephyria]|uniref:uncharacterized protein LOC108359610 n=1 Tax=Rhagoletis zephyria TaxID=28612 RepID=UPI0008115F39|nr:PREDICTED: uncharacterized protein LOC108359610 [Rhagoletis zephyria]
MPKSSKETIELNKRRLCCRVHSSRYCHAFKAMTPAERYESARVHKYCVNCLATSHVTGACHSPASCHRCGKAHHTLLHRASFSSPGRSRREVNRKKTVASRRAIRKPKGRVQSRTSTQQRIRELFKRAMLTLQSLQQLLRIPAYQAGRHVGDVSADLTDR